MELDQYWQFGAALIFVLALIGLLFWIIQRVGVGGGRGKRGSRLGVVEAAVVDKKRRLVLVRRDATEHLIMIGGPQDVVVEAGINRREPQLTGTSDTAAADPDLGIRMDAPVPQPEPRVEPRAPALGPAAAPAAPRVEPEPSLPPQPAPRPQPHPQTAHVEPREEAPYAAPGPAPVTAAAAPAEPAPDAPSAPEPAREDSEERYANDPVAEVDRRAEEEITRRREQERPEPPRRAEPVGEQPSIGEGDDGPGRHPWPPSEGRFQEAQRRFAQRNEQSHSQRGGQGHADDNRMPSQAAVGQTSMPRNTRQDDVSQDGPPREPANLNMRPGEDR